MEHVDEPVYDIAYLSHIELLTPRPEESQRFFTEVLSLQVVGQQGQSVYLRGYGDYERTSLTLTEAPAAGLGHAAFRSPDGHLFELFYETTRYVPSRPNGRT